MVSLHVHPLTFLTSTTTTTTTTTNTIVHIFHYFYEYSDFGVEVVGCGSTVRVFVCRK